MTLGAALASGAPIAAGTPLGIICGSGAVPATVAAAAVRAGRTVVMFPLRGWADERTVAPYRHHWIALAQFGRFCRLARNDGCRDIVLVGALVRPAFRELRLDWGTIRQLPRIARAFRGGDDHLLTGVGRIMEANGFRLVGAQEIAPEITAPVGPLGHHQPDPGLQSDIDRGFEVLAAMSPFDIGQAVVVAGRRVLAVEAAEGTDAMLERVTALRASGRIRLRGRAGVLVKAPKRCQDRRFDLPSIGPDTIGRAAEAGLAGVAIVAGATIVAEPQRVVAAADGAGMFVVGCPDAGQG